MVSKYLKNHKLFESHSRNLKLYLVYVIQNSFQNNKFEFWRTYQFSAVSTTTTKNVLFGKFWKGKQLESERFHSEMLKFLFLKKGPIERFGKLKF